MYLTTHIYRDGDTCIRDTVTVLLSDDAVGCDFADFELRDVPVVDMPWGFIVREDGIHHCYVKL